MPDTTTTNYNFTKPEVGASRDTWGTKLNDNWDAVDAALNNLSSSPNVYSLITDLESSTVPTSVNLVLVRGESTVEDGGGGWYARQASEPDEGEYTQDGNSVYFLKVAPYRNEQGVHATTYGFGKPGNSGAQNAAALQEALDQGVDVCLPLGRYSVNATSLIKANNQSIYSPVKNGTEILWTGGDAPIIAQENYDSIDAAGFQYIAIQNITFIETNMTWTDDQYGVVRERWFSIDLTNHNWHALINVGIRGEDKKTLTSDDTHYHIKTITASTGQVSFDFSTDDSGADFHINNGGELTVKVDGTEIAPGEASPYGFVMDGKRAIKFVTNTGDPPTYSDYTGLEGGESVTIERTKVTAEPGTKSGAIMGKRVFYPLTKWYVGDGSTTDFKHGVISSGGTVGSGEVAAGGSFSSRHIWATVDGLKVPYTVYADDDPETDIVRFDTAPEDGAIVKVWYEQPTENYSNPQSWLQMAWECTFERAKLFMNDGDCQIIGGYMYGLKRDYNVRFGTGGLRMIGVQTGGGTLASILFSEPNAFTSQRSISVLGCHLDGTQGWGNTTHFISSFFEDDLIERCLIKNNFINRPLYEAIKLLNARACEISGNAFNDGDDADTGMPDIRLTGEGCIIGPNVHFKTEDAFRRYLSQQVNIDGNTGGGHGARSQAANIAIIKQVADGTSDNYWYYSPFIEDGGNWYNDVDFENSTTQRPLMDVAGAVANSRLADMAQYEFKGRISSGSGQPQDLTPDNAITAINQATTNRINANRLPSNTVYNDDTFTFTGTVTFSNAPNVPSHSWVFSDLPEIAQYRVYGRTSSGTGDTTALTPDNLWTLLNQATSSVSQTPVVITVTSATNIGDISNVVNTTNKLRGRVVINSTDNKMYWAVGATAASAWQAVDGSGSITPS